MAKDLANEKPEYSTTITTISVKKSTHKRIARLCRKDQTYDNLLNELADEREKKGGK